MEDPRAMRCRCAMATSPMPAIIPASREIRLLCFCFVLRFHVLRIGCCRMWRGRTISVKF